MFDLIILLLCLTFMLAQVTCTNVNVGSLSAPPQTVITFGCDLENTSNQEQLQKTTGKFSTVANSNQVPRLPNQVVINFRWNASSGLGNYSQLNVYNKYGAVIKSYVFGFGTSAQSPTINIDSANQQATLNVSDWPSEFQLELVQYYSLNGVTHVDFDIRLMN